MGSKPRTKSDYRKKIADIDGEIAHLRAMLPSLKDGVNRNKSMCREHIANLQAKKARLKAEMADAPKD